MRNLAFGFALLVVIGGCRYDGPLAATSVDATPLAAPRAPVTLPNDIVNQKAAQVIGPTSAVARNINGSTNSVEAIAKALPVDEHRRCGFNFDLTTSVQGVERDEMIKRVDASLADFVRDGRCTSVSVAGFTDGGLFTHIEHFSIPREKHSPCLAAASTPARRALQYFQGYQDLTDERCRTQSQQENSASSRARDAVLAHVHEAMRDMVTTKSDCTDIVGHLELLQRLSHPNDIDFVFSDLAQTCLPSGHELFVRGRIMFVLLPGTGNPREQATEAAARAIDITNLLHGSNYLVPAQIEADRWWQEVLQ
jgi:hypothetical protein